MNMDFGKFFKMGERGFNLERLFNIREGFSAKDDTLPKRFTHEEQIPGNEKTKVPLDKMMPTYYKLRGWDEKGIPTPKVLKKLGMEDLIQSPIV
ncbi:MAG TPA: aldehyde ferredoxin oxidoreductase C-terminal domain-containing protein, partial [Deltaproteobacteria bacterium]|nr:aldehyde ferredoxin oxidoreductase C-terminal domain-containing protein [Deltaproteobacteria bacterium]